jgi:plastocyanin
MLRSLLVRRHTLTVLVCCIALSGCALLSRSAPVTGSSGTDPGATNPISPTASSEPVATRRPKVVIIDAAFQPQTIVINAGQTVTWVNDDPIAHAVTADQGGFDLDLPPGSTRTHRLTRPATIAYTCRIHPANPDMHGQVIVS